MLDVAGGAGSLCWDLAIQHGLGTTVVDPKPVRLSKAKTKIMLALSHIVGSLNGSSVRSSLVLQLFPGSSLPHPRVPNWVGGSLLDERSFNKLLKNEKPTTIKVQF